MSDRRQDADATWAALVEGEASGLAEASDFEAFLEQKRRDWQPAVTVANTRSGC